MSFLYVQRTGQMYRDRCLFAKGYAGIYTGKNNPNMQQTHNTGPLPCGIYRISDAYKHTALGPLTMDLKPDVANEMFKRDYFRIHGDSEANPGMASHGCIVLPHANRVELSLLVQAGERELEVVAETPEELK